MRVAQMTLLLMVAVCAVGCSSSSSPPGRTVEKTSSATTQASSQGPRGFVLDDPRTAGASTPTCLPAVSDWIAKRGTVEVTVNVNGPTTVRVTVATTGATLAKSQRVSGAAGTATIDFTHLAAAAAHRVTVSATANAQYRAGRCVSRYSPTG